MIQISVPGPLPPTLLLPYADLFWTDVLAISIDLVMASAFASIPIDAMELVPDRIGSIGGLFYGLNFGSRGVAAAPPGGLADAHGIETVCRIGAFLPLIGLRAWLLPRLDEAAPAGAAKPG